MDRARELRSAIIVGDHALAQQLATAYVDALRTLWESMPEEQRSVSMLPSEARALLLWAHQSTLIQKAIAADQLAVAQKALRYHPSKSDARIQLNA